MECVWELDTPLYELLTVCLSVSLCTVLQLLNDYMKCNSLYRHVFLDQLYWICFVLELWRFAYFEGHCKHLLIAILLSRVRKELQSCAVSAISHWILNF